MYAVSCQHADSPPPSILNTEWSWIMIFTLNFRHATCCYLFSGKCLVIGGESRRSRPALADDCRRVTGAELHLSSPRKSTARFPGALSRVCNSGDPTRPRKSDPSLQPKLHASTPTSVPKQPHVGHRTDWYVHPAHGALADSGFVRRSGILSCVLSSACRYETRQILFAGH